MHDLLSTLLQDILTAYIAFPFKCMRVSGNFSLMLSILVQPQDIDVLCVQPNVALLQFLGHPSSYQPSTPLLNFQYWPDTLRVAVKASSYSKAIVSYKPLTTTLLPPCDSCIVSS